MKKCQSKNIIEESSCGPRKRTQLKGITDCYNPDAWLSVWPGKGAIFMLVVQIGVVFLVEGLHVSLHTRWRSRPFLYPETLGNYNINLKAML